MRLFLAVPLNYNNVKEANIPALVAFSVSIVILFFVLIACLISALHKVNEGCVGVYFKNGALLNTYANPGN